MYDFGHISRIINKQKYEWSTRLEIAEAALYSLAGFFLPFMLGHPQWLVGTIVNAMLISGALTVRGYKLLPIILLPSLGVLAAGLIFGNFTVFLLYLIPFIWMGNAVLVGAFKFFNVHKRWKYFPTLIIGSVTKAGFLFAAAFALYHLGLVPVVFLTAMGWLQLLTALSGGVLAFGFEKVKRIIC